MFRALRAESAWALPALGALLLVLTGVTVTEGTGHSTGV